MWSRDPNQKVMSVLKYSRTISTILIVNELARICSLFLSHWSSVIILNQCLLIENSFVVFKTSVIQGYKKVN